METKYLLARLEKMTKKIFHTYNHYQIIYKYF